MGQAGGTAGRLAWVDVAKGICILLVVMMHSVIGTGEAMGGEGFLHPVVAFAKPFRIPDFFLLSGLFLGPRHRPGLAAVLRPPRRALRLLLPALARDPVGRPVREDRRRRRVRGTSPAHLAHALIEPYSSLWFIYLLAVFSVVTKALRRVPAAVLLAGAALLQIADLRSDSTLIEEFCARYV